MITPDEIRHILQDLGLTQVEAAELCGVQGRTMRRWIKDPDKMPLTAVETLYSWQYFENNGRAWPLHKLH